MGLVHTDVGETDFKYWDHALKDFDDDKLMTGLKAAQNFTGYLTLGAFKELIEQSRPAPCHKPYNPNQIEHKKMTIEQRKAAMAKLRAEVGI